MDPRQRQLGPYRLLHRLGAGGMAETFLAVRHGPGGFEQRVCLKRILPAFEQDAEFVRLFLEEARVSARLRHANVAQVLDFGVVDGSHFLALELVEGLDLRALLRVLAAEDDRLTSGLVCFLAYELSAALDFAHGATRDGQPSGVVHRDVSPSNVLLSTAGEVKLTDFGIAKAWNQPGVTESGVVKGKVPYMAPEYARTGRFDPRSDLFALGVTLYESLAGRRPFQGVTDLDTLDRIGRGVFTPLREHVPTAPAQLVEAIESLLAAEPDDRPQTAGALLDALVDVAPPPTARRILGELVRRHLPERPVVHDAAPSSVTTRPDPGALEEVAPRPSLRAGEPGGTLVWEPAQEGTAALAAETRTRLPVKEASRASRDVADRAAPRRRGLALGALAMAGVALTVALVASHGAAPTEHGDDPPATEAPAEPAEPAEAAA
ncbi:MAG: protein kinase, partial [Myxococcota bacterium]